MRATSRQILHTYITLTLLSTFASSFIWGINTLFLLDAGLSITEAFMANAFYTLGQVLFEVPTGVVADTAGRRTSYLLGSATLFGSTLLYVVLWQIGAPFWLWAIASMLLGLGFTFFSGATEAWLVDGLQYTKYKGTLESAFAKGQVAVGIAMLGGTLSGGFIAQFTNLGVPYIVRSVILAVTFCVTLALMHDVGFKPRRGASVTSEVRTILKASLEHGFRNRPVRLVMLSGPFIMGAGVYGFYAIQPHLLNLYGRDSYAIAGLAAALVAVTQILGGVLVPYFHKIFRRRTSMLIFNAVGSFVMLGLIGLISSFWPVLVFLAIWATLFAASFPIRQAYINELIPSEQRATVLSSDNLLSSAGGVVMQPALGKTADIWGYPASYLGAAVFQVMAVPFLVLARRRKASSDVVEDPTKIPPAGAVTPPLAPTT